MEMPKEITLELTGSEAYILLLIMGHIVAEISQKTLVRSDFYHLGKHETMLICGVMSELSNAINDCE